MRGRDQHVLFVVEFGRGEVLWKRTIKIGYAGIKAHFLKAAHDFPRGHRADLNRKSGMHPPKDRRHTGGEGQRCRHRPERHCARKAALCRFNVLFQAIRVLKELASPAKRDVAFGCEAREPVATLDDGRAECVLEILDPGREGRLGNPARIRRPSEVAMARKGDQKLHVPQFRHGSILNDPARWKPDEGWVSPYAKSR